MVKRNIVLLDIDYITHDEKPVMRLFGKVKGEKSNDLIALDDSFVPYLYILPVTDIDKCMKDLEELEKEDELEFTKLEKVLKKDFQVPTEFIKISFNHPQDVPKYRDKIWDLDSVKQLREHDIPFYRRYLIDNGLVPMAELELEGELIDSFETIDSDDDSLEILKLNESPKTANTDFQQFRMMSFDLEVRNPHGMPNPNEDEIIMIGIDSNVGVRKVISTKGDEFEQDPEMYFIEKVDSEKEMIESFIKTVKENNIDIIIGYNSDVFDFPYLKDRAKIWGIDLDLGVDGSSIKFIRRGYNNAATFKGLLHVDLYLVMRRYMSLDRYTLERVYFEFFGEEKIDVPGDRIYEFWDNGGKELKNLFKYSLDDVVSTLKIAQETLPLNLELTRIVGQPFVDVTRMATGQQAEWYLVRKAYEVDEVVPNKPNMTMKNIKERGSNSGGYVKEPEIGLHENLVQFDFKSLYPTLIISKNISPDVLVNGNSSYNAKFEDFEDYETCYDEIDSIKEDEMSSAIDDEEYYISPEHFFKFKKEPQGFIPSALEDILNERFAVKNRMKATDDPILRKGLDVQQQALKRLANTMYGVYGFLRFRWYSFECAQSITAWGRQHIKKAMKEAEDYGFKAIYADTDGFYAKYVPEMKKE
ncbi:DNA-directed DNA polymerase [Methanobrevibacter ruminantium]|uniref:DNA-directed DNA polymerase n=1 Tax=Methanobrevibacter ruminantium TaxID=83816 RepID=UPI0026EFFE0A|nr:DNA-directed DNA polymerase [Methanobrevibacter ruminantium]MCI5737609.1 DNA-directed DNA polymerase [Methanobrevibacter ruminantium]